MSRETTHEILSAGKRVQHLLAVLGCALCLLTGAALPGGSGIRIPALTRLLGGADIVPWWHSVAGLLTAVVLAGHLLYLAVRGYIENIPWRGFPYRPTAADWRGVTGGLVPALRGARSQSRHAPFRKGFYWSFLVLSAVQVVTGAAVRYWDLLDIGALSGSVGLLGGLHGGGAFVLALLVLWHVYEVSDGGTRPRILLAAISGRMAERDLVDLYPDEVARILEAGETGGEEAWGQADLERLEAEALAEERGLVEGMLEEGNRLAREGQLAEAAAEYRRALERFPAYSQAHYNLAVVLEKDGRREEALAAYRRFMEVDPFHPLSEKVSEALRRLEG